MIFWTFYLIPIISILILVAYFRNETARLEYVVVLISGALFILVGKNVIKSIQSTTTEYYTGYVTESRYYESWNEEVPCRHPIYCTSCSGSGKNRTCTEYVCGHHHAYDVDWHPEYWQLTDNNGYTDRIDKPYFESLASRWSERSFVDLKRSYHSKDGDMYITNWNQKDQDAEIVTHSHSYENRIINSNSVFKFQDVKPEEKEQYGLYDYPEVKGLYQKELIGGDEPDAERKLSILNGKLGKDRQIKVFILVYTGKDITSSTMQESYWKGGNKNELNVTIGIDSAGLVTWGRVFSWTDKEKVKIDVRSLIEEQIGNRLELVKIVDKLPEIINESWVRKEFKDFSYLEISPTTTQLIMFITLFSIIICAIMLFVVKNDWR